MTDFADRQRDRRARGQHGTAALLASLEATTPPLRVDAEGRVLAGHDPLDDVHDPVVLTAALRGAIADLRMLNAQRELAQLAAVLRDDPGHPDELARRRRARDLVGWIRDAERCGTVRPRPWARILATEGRR